MVCRCFSFPFAGSISSCSFSGGCLIVGFTFFPSIKSSKCKGKKPTSPWLFFGVTKILKLIRCTPRTGCWLWSPPGCCNIFRLTNPKPKPLFATSWGWGVNPSDTVDDSENPAFTHQLRDWFFESPTIYHMVLAPSKRRLYGRISEPSTVTGICLK